MTRPGQWLQPRHGSREAFEKDFPHIVSAASIEISCPGCGSSVKLTRRSPAGKVGGWCVKCNRGVGL